MRRRAFLGGVLGLVAGTQIPAEVSNAIPIPNWITKAKRQLRCFELNSFDKFRIDLLVTNNYCYKGLPIIKITKQEKQIRFEAHTINIQRKMIIIGFRLIDDIDYIISEKQFSYPINMKIGYSLNLTYDLKFVGDV